VGATRVDGGGEQQGTWPPREEGRTVSPGHSLPAALRSANTRLLPRPRPQVLAGRDATRDSTRDLAFSAPARLDRGQDT
jgi:hypothetical protein